MSSASRGMAPREGLESLLVKMGHTGPHAEPRCGPQAGKSRDPCSQNTDKRSRQGGTVRRRCTGEGPARAR